MSRVVVVGGGLVGMAVANGLADAGCEVVVADGDDADFRASRGNAGLIWVQGKGDSLPAYAAWTRRSAELWPGFAAMLAEATGIDVEYRRPGGFHLCLSEREWDARSAMVRQLTRDGANINDVEMVDRQELRRRLPRIGDAVIGASWCRHDGVANPLKLLWALHARAAAAGVDYRPGDPVQRIARDDDGRFTIATRARTLTADRVVLSAGLGNAALAPQVGLNAPVRPVRGQIVVTERIPRFLDHPTSTIRQNEVGTVMFGNSVEPDAGFDPATSLSVTARHARRAVMEFPHLAEANVVRSWAALRVMPPDALPIYAQSRTCPGAFVVTCHSGVTLAAVHAGRLAPAIASGTLPPECADFDDARFDAQASDAA